MSLDYENLTQRKTPFRCPECGEQTFQTDRELRTPHDLVEAECTNCGHPLTGDEIALQLPTISSGELSKTFGH